MTTDSRVGIRAGIGFTVGAAAAAIDNFAFGGEVSPIVIVGILVIFGAVSAMMWGVRAISAAVVAWVWLPMAHALKHFFGLPDTLHPNTWASILKLGSFSFLVTALGLGIGLTFRDLYRRRFSSVG